MPKKRIISFLIILVLMLNTITTFNIKTVEAAGTNIIVSSLTTDKPSPQTAGSTIKISAVATGTASPLYKFWIYDGQAWKIVQDYSEVNTYQWTPSDTGNYKIWVDVKDKNSYRDPDTYREISYAVRSNAAISSVDTDLASPQIAGSTIKISANGSNSKNTLYKFWIHDGQQWKVVQDYSLNNSYKWIPARVAKYRIWVDVKDKYSSNSVDSYKEISYEVKQTASLKSINVDKVSPAKLGETINITANSLGGSNLIYRFWIHDGQTWKVAQEYSEKNICQWTPTATGNYTIWVDVKEKSSAKEMDDYKEISYTVTSPISLDGIELGQPSPSNTGTTVKITAKASGSSNILYKFWIFNGQSWTVVQDYSSQNTYDWTPTKGGSYRIWVDVKDKYSRNAVDCYKEVNHSVKASATLNSLSTSLNSPQMVGKTIKLTASAEGVKEIVYRFWIHDGRSWNIVQDYSSSNVYIWQPTAAGKYCVWAEVKSKDSTSENESYKAFDFIITENNTQNDIFTNVNSPQILGNTINVTAKFGNNANLLYKFWICDGQQWQVVQDYSSKDNYQWKPSKIGAYRIWVDVKSQGSSASADISKELIFKIVSPVQVIETNFTWNGSFEYSNKPDTIILHHAEATSATVLDVNRWHQQNGWTGIGYQYYIRKDGTIYRGRPEGARGAHCPPANGNSIGICCEGAYEREEYMPEAQKKALIALCEDIRTRYEIDNMYGHGEVYSTSCPGRYFPLQEVRDVVMNNK